MVYKYHTNSMELTNVILKWVSPITKVSDRLEKREIVVETLGQYPQLLKFEVHNGRCADYDSIPLESMISIRFELCGRKWKNRDGKEVLIESKVAYSVHTNVKSTYTHSVPAQTSAPAPAPAKVTDSDDLPF
jgi:hypothetical protein